MISDLLPLYKDGVCSNASKKIIEEHLAECPACGKMLKDMIDSTIDEELVKEKNEVIDSQAKFFKRKSALVGSIVGGIFCVPILVCLIVNLATGAGLTWFFIVLAAMLVAASLIIVPLMMPKNKLSRQQLKKLKVYGGPEHPHAAQNPQPYEITQIAQ